MSEQSSLQPLPSISFNLDNLSERIPAIPGDANAYHGFMCRICLDDQSHPSGVILNVHWQREITPVIIQWSGEVSERDKRGARDERKATDYGACALTLLFIDYFTDYTAYEQSVTGDTIDYFLAPKAMLAELLQEETLIFNAPGTYPIAYLESSGIRCENEGNTVNARIAAKKRRLNTTEDLPTFIAVIEFSKPYAKIVKI